MTIVDSAATPGSVRGLAANARLRYVAAVLTLTALYYGSAKIGFVLGFSGPIAAIVWLPVGVAVSFLSLGGLGLWPGVLAGDLLANNYAALPAGTAIVQTVGNVLEVLVASILIRRLLRREPALRSVGGLVGLLLAIALGTAVSATVGAVSLRLGHVAALRALPEIWQTWWLGDACGALIVVPFALAWHDWRPQGWAAARTVESALVLVAIVGLSELALHSRGPQAYLVFPALIWATLRFGGRGATLAILVTSSFAVWHTTHETGPFVWASISRSVLATQVYIGVAAISTLCLATVVAEREEFARRLTASRARLVRAADTERRRLEHNLHDGAQQRLTALAVHLSDAARMAEQAPEYAPALFEAAETELQVAIEELRELARGIHPTVLTDLGLAKAIRSVAARSTIPIQVLELPSDRLDANAEAAAYYVIAEAVTNAQKHAQASSIRVRAGVSRRVLHIEVADDGVGGATERGGSGLQGLRDRVEANRGTLRVESAPGRGTRVAATIPVPTVA